MIRWRESARQNSASLVSSFWAGINGCRFRNGPMTGNITALQLGPTPTMHSLCSPDNGPVVRIAPERFFGQGWKSQQPTCTHQRIWTRRQCQGSSSVAVNHRWAGRMFGLCEAKDVEWWDSACLFHPIVVKDPSAELAPWRMYYYGRNRSSWHSGVSPALLSTGRVGMALSEDGLSWARLSGALPQGAILDPDEQNPQAFDCVHVGCSDVVHYDGEWWMYYLGGSLEAASLGHGRLVRGMRMRVGLVRSARGVEFWRERDNLVLDVGGDGEWDGAFVAWARVIPPTSQQLTWLMTYSSMEASSDPSSPPRSSIGVATSLDGRSWHKLGKVLQAGEVGCWDEGGVSRRHVVKTAEQYLMFYEGVDRNGVHGIGLATSPDGVHWEKDLSSGRQPGGPVLTARVGDEDAWDNGLVAAPHVVCLDDGSFRLYYVGNDRTKRNGCFGVAVSQGTDYRTWTRIR